MEGRRCAKCGTDNRGSRCRACWAAYMRRWRAATRSADKLKRVYGISADQRDQMLASQGGRCAICANDLLAVDKHTHVDHCHATGRIRGMLCSHCNLALGHMRDDAARLRAAADYLDRCAAASSVYIK